MKPQTSFRKAIVTRRFHHYHTIQRPLLPPLPLSQQPQMQNEKNYNVNTIKKILFVSFVCISEMLPFLETESNGILHHISKVIKESMKPS